MAELPDWAISFALKERVYSSGADEQVTVREDAEKRPLDARTDLQDYSETLEWGCDSVGAAQLSLALLADALDNDARAQSIHQQFKSRVIVDMPERWTMTRSRILAHAKCSKDSNLAGRAMPRRQVILISRSAGTCQTRVAH